MPELVHLRTLTSKTIDNGDGTRTVQAFSQPVHYDDGQGGMAEIDGSIIPSTRTGYDWMNAANDFELHFKENLNQDASILFIRGGVEIATRPKGVVMHRKDTGAHLVLGTPSDTTCIVSEDEITFFGLYPNCQVRYQSTATGVKEFIRMTSFNGIPDPLDYGINPEVVRIGFVTELNPIGHDGIDDGDDGAIAENIDYDTVAFKKAGKRSIFIPKLLAWSEGGDGRRVERTVTKRIKMIDGKPHLIHGMNYAELVSRRLPYIIDASFNINPALGGDDGSSTTLNQFFNTQTFHYVGHEVPSKDPQYSEEMFFRLPNIPIPQGSTINSATFGLFRNGRVGLSQPARLYFADADNSLAPVSRASHLAVVRTTAYTALTVGGTNATSWEYYAATDQVQEVVNRAGWTSGYAMMALMDYYGATGGNAYTAYRTYDSGSLPVLSVTYTESSTKNFGASCYNSIDSSNTVLAIEHNFTATITSSITSNTFTLLTSLTYNFESIASQQLQSTDASLKSIMAFEVAADTSISSADSPLIVDRPFQANVVGRVDSSTLTLINIASFELSCIAIVDSSDAVLQLEHNLAGNFPTSINSNDIALQTAIEFAAVAATTIGSEDSNVQVEFLFSATADQQIDSVDSTLQVVIEFAAVAAVIVDSEDSDVQVEFLFSATADQQIDSVDATLQAIIEFAAVAVTTIWSEDSDVVTILLDSIEDTGLEQLTVVTDIISLTENRSLVSLTVDRGLASITITRNLDSLSIKTGIKLT